MARTTRQPSVGQKLARQAKPNLNKEIGVGGSGAYSFRGEEYNFDASKGPSIKDLIRMRKTDGTAAGLYNILTLPIMSNSFRIDPDPADKGEIQSTFVWDALTLPVQNGGMSTPMSLVIADMLRAVLEGYRLFELVYKVNPDGKVVFRKIASREATTLTLLRDDNGGFAGAKQEAFKGDKYVSVYIPVEVCFLYTFGKEKNQVEGESAFLSAYYHYDKKHRAYFLANQALQTMAIPPKVGTAPSGATPADRQTNLDAIDALGVRSSIMMPAGWTLDIPNIGNGKTDPMPLINHHNSEMALSVLAQFLMLGSAGGGTGSYALSENHSDIFIMALKGTMRTIEEHINAYLIPKLVDINFETPLYPTFRFNDLTNATLEMMSKSFDKLIEKIPQGIPAWMVTEIVDKMADHLGIEKPEGANDDPVPGATPDAPQFSRDSKKKIELAASPWWRPLNQHEKKVNFSALEKKYTQFEADYIAAAKPVLEKIMADAVKRIKAILSDKDPKDIEQLEGFTLNYADEYASVIAKEMLTSYTYAKQGASDEMGVKIPSTPQDTKILIQQQAKAVADKQLSDLLFKLKTTLTDAVRKNKLSRTNLSLADILGDLEEDFDEFVSKAVTLAASAGIAQAINYGRNDVFQANATNIRSYQYSAILDDSVCPICADLDGSVVSQAEYDRTQWQPPIHFHCRCIWVEILEDELDPPEVTGLPDDPGGQNEPSL